MKIIKKLKYIISVIVIVVLLAVIGYIYFDDEPEQQLDEYNWQSTVQTEYIEYGGEKYEKNPNVRSILIGGVDSLDKIDLSSNHGGQTDMLMVLVLNSDTKTIDILQINRDTMTLIDVLNENNISVGDATAQIALAHSYGNGGTVSSSNTVKAVENLLFGIDINKYIFLNMGAIPTVNDYFGGVEVLIEDDFSNIDLTLVKGETVRLDGVQALNYLRSRHDINDPSNINRMKRHRTYINSFINSVRTYFSDIDNAKFDLYNNIYDYMSTSISQIELASLIKQSYNYTINEPIVPEGNFSQSSSLEEFYVDDEKLRETVIRLFYRKVYE